MLKIDLSTCLGVLNILSLACLLLYKLVGHQKADHVVHHAYTQSVARREIPFVGSREPRGISPVRVIRQHRRIEIALCMKSLCIRRKSVRSLRIRNSRRAVHRRETSAARVKPPVPSCWNVFLRGDFDNAAQLPPVFGWKTRCQHAQGLDFARIKRRRKRRRAILRQRQAVHHKLHVVLRAARMKHAIGFEYPSRLFGHQVQQFAPRLRRVTFLDRLPPDRVERANGIGIHERRRIFHLHLRRHWRNAQCHCHTHRYLRANFNQIAPRRKTSRLQTQAVNSKRKILRNVAPLRPRNKRSPNSAGLADQLTAG